MKHLLLGAVLFLSGCSHSIHLVNASGFSPYGWLKSGKLIRAEATKKIYLGFAQDTDYVDQAYEKIQAQCRGGQIKGVTTQFSTSHGFLHWTNKILIQSVCIKS